MIVTLIGNDSKWHHAVSASENEEIKITEESVFSSNNKSEEEVYQELNQELTDYNCMILRHVDEQSFATAGHVERLVKAESLDTYAFKNQDGSTTVYYMGERVKFVDEEGSVKDRDISLVSHSNGYQTRQNDVQLNIPNNPNLGITLCYGEHNVSIVPEVSTARIVTTLNDNAVTYENYWGQGIDLRYTPMLSGVKEDIILDAYTGISEFEFVLNTDGLFLKEKDGAYSLYTADNKLIFDLSSVIIYDAMGKPDEGFMEVNTILAGEIYHITIGADRSFLTDPDTVYPVTIDPTMVIADDNWGPNRIQDAPIFSGKPTSNFGNYIYNRLGNTGTDYGIGRTVMRLNGTSPGFFHDGIGDIISAKLYIKESSGRSPVSVGLYPILSNTTWSETGVTWNNVGTWSAVSATGVTLNSNSWASFEFASLIRKWQSGLYNVDAGFILISNSEDTINKSFHSAEGPADCAPYYTITYVSTEGSLDRTVLDLAEDQSYTLLVQNMPTENATWTSSAPSVASVNSTGVVTAHSEGVALITLSVPEFTDKTCVVYVHTPVTYNARIYYDSSCTLSGSQLRNTYEEAVEPFAKFFGINFTVNITAYSSSLNLSSSCSAPGKTGICTASCGALTNCSTLHHKSAVRLINLLKSNTLYTCRVVGYSICYLNPEKNTHSGVAGLAAIGGKNIIASEAGSPNLRLTIQHELSHNLGAPDHDYNGQGCIMQGSKSGYDTWCDSCAETIRNAIS